MCINIDIVLHHETIKRYFDSFLTRRETLGCVGQKCVRPPPPIFFDRYAYGKMKLFGLHLNFKDLNNEVRVKIIDS